MSGYVRESRWKPFEMCVLVMCAARQSERLLRFAPGVARCNSSCRDVGRAA